LEKSKLEKRRNSYSIMKNAKIAIYRSKKQSPSRYHNYTQVINKKAKESPETDALKFPPFSRDKPHERRR